MKAVWIICHPKGFPKNGAPTFIGGYGETEDEAWKYFLRKIEILDPQLSTDDVKLYFVARRFVMEEK